MGAVLMMILSFAILWGMTAAMYFVVLPIEIDEAIRMSRKMPTTQLRQLAKADALRKYRAIVLVVLVAQTLLTVGVVAMLVSS